MGLTKSNEFTDNINGIIAAARKYNSKIGNRDFHGNSERGDIVVRLTGNATIRIGRAYARDGVETMSEEEIKAVANSYSELQ